jgi:2-isopropylmalate synthase
MLLSIGETTIAATRAEGAGPVDALTKAMRQELEKWYPAIAQVRLGRFSVTAIDVSAHDTAAHVRVTVSFHADGHEPWTTAGVSSDLNQAALMAIVDGFHFWLLESTILETAELESSGPETLAQAAGVRQPFPSLPLQAR